MNNLLFKLLIVSLLIESMVCCKAQKLTGENLGVLKGITGVYTGNCMPAPNKPPCKPKPTSTTVYITQLAEHYSSEKVVDSVISNSSGKFMLKLPAGSYSLFLKDEQQVVCPVTQCDPQCACMPVKIQKDSITTVTPNLDRATW